MSKHNRHNHQQPSQRPAQQQVAVRPESLTTAGDVPLDTQRVPSAATDEQSQVDAAAADPDRYRPQEGVTDTDPVAGEATDLPTDENSELASEDDEPNDDAEEGDDFEGFEDINTRTRNIRRPEESKVVAPERVRTVIDMTEEERERHAMELVPVIPRRTELRTSINGEWYNFKKGVEQFVPRAVAEHCAEKGLI